MKTRIINIVQTLLGVFMITLGLNKFLVFIEIPNPPGDGGELMRIYITSGFLKLVGILEVIGGLGLLANKFVPINLTLIIAIMFNATLFHAFHDLAGIGAAFLGLILSLVLVVARKERFLRFFEV